jgi:hypothetical protein
MLSQPKLTRVQADPYEGPLPHAYVILKQSQMCRCGHLHQWSTMMTETVTRSNLGSLTIFHRRVDEVKYNLPIKREVLQHQTEKLMFCHECVGTATLSHLPPLPRPDPKPIVGGFQPSKPAPKAAKPQVTLDDLLI